MPNAFAAYSDESGCFSRRYQAIGVISGKKSTLSHLRTTLDNILNEKKITEVKFYEVGTYPPKIEAAHEFVKKTVDFARKTSIRVDVLIWDTRDSRHSIRMRNDIANLERMYYKVLRHVSEQWHQINWEFYPDEQSAVDWKGVISYLNKTKFPRRKPRILKLFNEERCQFNFVHLEKMKSDEEPLIQLSDLFAGMARFTREKGKRCIQFLNSQKSKDQLLLIHSSKKINKFSRNDRNRFILIGAFYNLCKKCKLGVSLNSKKYLWTCNPYSPINFWNYESQGEYDKAPTKSGQKKS